MKAKYKEACKFMKALNAIRREGEKKGYP